MTEGRRLTPPALAVLESPLVPLQPNRRPRSNHGTAGRQSAAANRAAAMSVHVSSDVWRYSKATGGAFTVLLSLADQANDDGECWPKLATIASRSRVSRASVSRHLAQLRELGELDWEDRRARGLPNFYRVTVGATETQTPPQSETGGTSQSETSHVSPVSRQEPSLEPSVKDSSSGEPDEQPTTDEILSVFSDFWKAYPTSSTMSRKQALAQFVAAVRKRGADPQQLVVAAGRWAKECADRGTDPHYVRHAERWLRDERYEPYLTGPAPAAAPAGMEWF